MNEFLWTSYYICIQGVSLSGTDKKALFPNKFFIKIKLIKKKKLFANLSAPQLRTSPHSLPREKNRLRLSPQSSNSLFLPCKVTAKVALPIFESKNPNFFSD